MLKFTNEVDWLQAQTIFGLEHKKDYKTSEKGKMEQTGLGRVLDGAKVINELLG